MAAAHAEKLEGAVSAPPPPPGPPHPAGSAAAGPGRKQGKAGLQMKSPEKKRRKSNTQGPAYSHLSEFAPPPTPMVDHLVASNPFEDDFGAPKAGPAAAPFLGGPGPPFGGGGGGFRLQGGPPMAPQVPPGYGGPQALRRQPPPPPPPPFAPGQMGPAFGLPPQAPPGYGQPGAMGFAAQPFGQPLAQNFSPPAGQLLQGPGFAPIISPTMGQPPPPPPPPPPPRGDAGPPLSAAAGAAAAMAPRFGQPGNLFGQSALQRGGPSGPPLAPTASPFAGAEPGFAPGADESAKSLGAPGGAFGAEPHSGSPAAVNGAQPGFAPRGGGTPDANSLPAPGKTAGASGHQPPPGLVYPCGACRNEVNDDQDAILCEASCQKWFHRECTGMTESAYGLLTTEASAVWACDYCLKTKEIQSVYVREGLGQLVAANEG